MLIAKYESPSFFFLPNNIWLMVSCSITTIWLQLNEFVIVYGTLFGTLRIFRCNTETIKNLCLSINKSRFLIASCYSILIFPVSWSSFAAGKLCLNGTFAKPTSLERHTYWIWCINIFVFRSETDKLLTLRLFPCNTETIKEFRLSIMKSNLLRIQCC